MISNIKRGLNALFISVSLLCSLHLHAHSAAIATYKIQHINQKQWTVTISIPLGGLHLALLKHHKEPELWVKDKEENKQYNAVLAMDYLKQFSKIKVNGNTNIRLKDMRYNLDNHQSDFVFEMLDMPMNISKFDFDISAMSENEGHINIVRIKTSKGNKKSILQHHNNYKAELML
jgi:hypothetical protein